MKKGISFILLPKRGITSADDLQMVASTADVMFRITPDEYKRAKAIADDLDISVHDLARDALLDVLVGDWGKPEEKED